MNSMHGLNGVPVEFGVPLCDSELNCRNALVAAYNSVTDLWEATGEMMLSRRDHEVVEVPGEFCTRLGLGVPTTTTEVPTNTTTSEPSGDNGGDDDAAGRSTALSSLAFFLALALMLIC